MKLLRSPWVSGALAVIAVVVVIVQFVPLRGFTGGKAAVQSPAPPPPAPPPKSPPLAVKPSPALPELPLQAVECATVESRFARWAEAPGRDPFWLLPTASASEAPAHRYPSPVLVWKLQAIWRQTDGRVAAIDNKVYAEGDSIHGYRILKIDADRVVFEGPDGAEVLTFSQVAAAKPAKKK